jgi:hypothetical protein
MFRISQCANFARTVPALVAVCALISGCGPKQPKTYPVSITLTYPDKKPVVGAQVALRSEEHKTTARGATGSDGSCQVTTFNPNDGAVLGRNQVIVGKPPLIGDPDKPYTGPQIADKYSNFSTSGLEVDVTDDPSKNSFALTVTPR